MKTTSFSCLLIIIIALISCQPPEKTTILGLWSIEKITVDQSLLPFNQNNPGKMLFKENCAYEVRTAGEFEEGIWSIEDGKLKMERTNRDAEKEYFYQFVHQSQDSVVLSMEQDKMQVLITLLRLE